MSTPFGCHCEERKKPIGERLWRVQKRRCNHSAFNGYHETYSEYSTVCCLRCGAAGRTKAAYVALLPDWTEESARQDQARRLEAARA
jgi:hypothetical protein